MNPLFAVSTCGMVLLASDDSTGSPENDGDEVTTGGVPEIEAQPSSKPSSKLETKEKAPEMGLAARLGSG